MQVYCLVFYFRPVNTWIRTDSNRVRAKFYARDFGYQEQCHVSLGGGGNSLLERFGKNFICVED